MLADVKSCDDKLVSGWLTGPTCAEKLSRLSAELFHKIIEDVNVKFGTSYDSYNPWMSLCTYYPPYRPLLDLPFNLPLSSEDSEAYFSLVKDVFTKHTGDDEKGRWAEKAIGLESSEVEIETDPAILGQVNQLLDEAKVILFHACPWLQNVYKQLIFVEMFFRNKMDLPRYAHTTQLAKGVIFLASTGVKDPSKTAASLAVDLAHELGHSVLSVYLSADRIITSSYDALVYSGARKTERPAHKTLHASAALTFMIVACQGILQKCSHLHSDDPSIVKEKMQELQSELCKTLDSLETVCTFSPFGTLLMKELRTFT